MGTCSSCQSKEDLGSQSSSVQVNTSDVGFTGFNLRQGIQKKTSKVHHHSFKGRSTSDPKLLENKLEDTITNVGDSDSVRVTYNKDTSEDFIETSEQSCRRSEFEDDNDDTIYIKDMVKNVEQRQGLNDASETNRAIKGIVDNTDASDTETIETRTVVVDGDTGMNEDSSQCTDGFTTKRFNSNQDWLDIISEKDEFEHEHEMADAISLVESEIIDDMVNTENSTENVVKCEKITEKVNVGTETGINEHLDPPRIVEPDNKRNKEKHNRNQSNKSKVVSLAQPLSNAWEQGKVYIARGADGVLFRIRISRSSDKKRPDRLESLKKGTDVVKRRQSDKRENTETETKAQMEQWLSEFLNENGKIQKATMNPKQYFTDKRNTTPTKRSATPVKRLAVKRVATPAKRSASTPAKRLTATPAKRSASTPAKRSASTPAKEDAGEIGFLKEELYKLKRRVRRLEEGRKQVEDRSSNGGPKERAELYKLVEFETNQFKAMKTLLNKMFTQEELLMHTVSGKAPNSRIKAKPKFDGTKYNLFTSIILERFPSLESKDITAKVQAVQKNAQRKLITH